MAMTIKVVYSVILVTAIIRIGSAQTCGGTYNGGSNTGVYATYNEYYTQRTLAGTYCATCDSGMDSNWLYRYNWAAFCNPHDSFPDACGQCLLLTNPATGARATVRIIDQCSNGGLDLDVYSFRALDTNGAGYQAGHLYVNYQFFSC